MTRDTFDRRKALALIGAGAFLPSAATTQAAWAREAPIIPPEAEYAGDEDSVIGAMSDPFRRMTAPVMIDGKGPFDFVVDTGANRSIISNDLAVQLGLPPGRPTRVHGIAGPREAPTVKVGQFSFGSRRASNLSIATLPLGGLRAMGLLGVDGLKNQRVVFDMPGSRLEIVKSGKVADVAGGAVIPARRRFGQLTVVDTDLDGVRVSVLIDSGSEATVGNSVLRDLVTRNPRVDPLTEVRLDGATGDSVIAQFGAVPRFRLGTLTISNLRVAYADLHPFRLWDLTDKPALLMGMDVMRFFEEVALDYGRSEVRFVLPKQPFIDPASDPRRT